jgi:hypothetical protein
MSIISLTIAPLVKGNDDWENWYYGLVPLAIMVVGTYLVYHYFWKESMIITPVPDSSHKAEGNGANGENGAYDEEEPGIEVGTDAAEGTQG